MKIEILDHGYIELVETWGSDERIIESARMSTGKGFKGWGECKHPKEDTCGPECKGDEKLLRYLYINKHTTPFEMAGMTIEVQAPIFVFREWHRHRTQSYNEFSARYSELPNLFYMPSNERLISSSKTSKNKQESGTGKLDESYLEIAFNEINLAYSQCRQIYEGLLNQGISREIARLVIPVAQYSKMRASANLWNWLRFLKLRMNSHAQWEIRQYANATCETLSFSFPRTMKLFREEIDDSEGTSNRTT